MAGGGGFQDVSIDEMNTKISHIKPPSREERPELYEDDKFGHVPLDAWYSNEVSKVAKSMQPQDPQELTKNVTDAVTRSNAEGRLPDPDYDIVTKPGVDYSNFDWSSSKISALAAQRANDYLSDQYARAQEQRREMTKAEQDSIREQRLAYEEKRLVEASKSDPGERDTARKDRLNKLLMGKIRFGAGRSLLSLDDQDAVTGNTLLTGGK